MKLNPFSTSGHKKGEAAAALTTNKGQEKGNELDTCCPFFVELWNEIERDLGVVSDIKLVQKDDGIFKCQLHYKSNGVDKVAYSSDVDFKELVISLMYVKELISPIKKYTHAFLNPQQTL